MDDGIDLLGSDFGRTDFSRNVLGPPDFFADFVAKFFLLIFVGRKCPEKSSRKIRSRLNPPKFTQQKSPTHFCRGAGPRFRQKNVYVLKVFVPFALAIEVGLLGLLCHLETNGPPSADGGGPPIATM